ncbi:hypothetical protein H310_05899 [Aphanomyces invadans]|uniref:Uncharacterized protein n=1 Tax=Aphanomyces invadans TaxID=157072 RepID=A0A024U926_9STRA|nr:hypothetical protein H310_05899 [Aphanomyces invadans]ETW02372.1 hypothetical protein H310_05899 [Aphanomyces invadans]|eukprot:XP_008868977.1 hypothetical protein H310_05899 [Aphanomyces invadans]
MKKRRLLALPKSPEASQELNEPPPEQQRDKPPSCDVTAATVTLNPEGEVVNNTSVTDTTPPPNSHSILRHLYEKGVDEDWLQLAWMRVRVSPSDEFEVQLPEVSCSLVDLLRHPHNTPPSIKPAKDMLHTISANDKPSPPISKQNCDINEDRGREAYLRIQKWLLGKSETPRLAAADCLRPCDWAVLLGLFSSANVPISKFTTLISLAPNEGLYDQLWQHSDLVAALLQDQLKHDANVDVLLAAWMDCNWIVTVPAKDFRNSVRHMKLRDALGDATGARLELAIIELFHAQREKASWGQRQAKS